MSFSAFSGSNPPLAHVLRSLTSKGSRGSSEQQSVLSVTGAASKTRLFQSATEWQDVLGLHSLSVDEATDFEGYSQKGNCKLVILGVDDDSKTFGYLVSADDDGASTLQRLPADLDETPFTIEGDVDYLLLDNKAATGSKAGSKAGRPTTFFWTGERVVSVREANNVTRG